MTKKITDATTSLGLPTILYTLLLTVAANYWGSLPIKVVALSVIISALRYLTLDRQVYTALRERREQKSAVHLDEDLWTENLKKRTLLAGRIHEAAWNVKASLLLTTLVLLLDLAETYAS